MAQAPQASSVRRGCDDREAGATLVEVVMAMLLLGIMSAAVLGILFTAQSTSVDNRNRVAAANLAAREIDLVREEFTATDTGPITVANAGLVTNAHPLEGGTAGQPLVLDGTEYTVVRSVAWNITGSGASACEGGSAVEHPTLIVSVSVAWPNMGSTKPVTNVAALSPERGEGLPTTAAFAAVAVNDSAGQPSAGRIVTVSSASESRSGLTDDSGCAVISLNPPAGGIEYTASFPDHGYVDITGTTNPERNIGVVEPQQLAANVEIALDRAASLTIRMTGPGIGDADVAGSTISLYRSEGAGSTVTQHTVAGIDTLVDGLWPTQYAAFFGTVLPPTFTNITDLEPGAHAVLEVPFQFADFTVTDLPAPGTVLAVTPGGDCSTPGARAVDPAAGRLAPGTWSFLLQSPAFGCSTGPANVSLQPGNNGAVPWAETTLTVTNAPVGQGAIWAVSSGSAAASCTVANAVKLADDGAPVGPVELPAGNWYLYAMPDAGGVPSGGTCRDAGLVAVPYGVATTFRWTASSATVNVTNVTSAGAGSTWRVIASQTAVSSNCSSSLPSGAVTLTATSGGASTPTAASGTLSQNSWYFYRQRTSGSSNTNRCVGVTGNPFAVGWSLTYTLNFSTGAWTAS
jgi:type II secretory pathway pseudopilin PulG